MDGAGGDKDMEPRVFGLSQSLGRRSDVAFPGSSQATNRGSAQFSGNGLNAIKIAWRSRWEPGLNNVNARFFQLLGDLKLFGHVEIDPRGLLSIAEGRVKKTHAIWVKHDLSFNPRKKTWTKKKPGKTRRQQESSWL
jgi:hypothetical protein